MKGGSGFDWRALPVKKMSTSFEQWMSSELVTDARLVSIELSENQYGKLVARWSDLVARWSDDESDDEGNSGHGNSGGVTETWMLLGREPH